MHIPGTCNELTGLAFFGGGSFGSGRFLKRRPSDASSSPYAARAAAKYQTQKASHVRCIKGYLPEVWYQSALKN